MADPGRQPTLHTDRLMLVPLADDHLDHEIALDGDPAVMRYLGDGHPQTPRQVRASHQRRLDIARTAPGLGFWIGLRGGDAVGWWALEPPTRPDQGPPDGLAELGYRLLPRYWRQGLAGEGARALLGHAFNDLRLTRVFAETMAVNTASRATMAGIGMTYVRTFHLEWDDPLPGTEHGEVEYAITRQQWQTKR